ncbi:hypothetical protein [Deinococcus navajonensis]|uniref:Uncharacterized protein n=1 Tax=Deinococcus navajonensis TaxID=309884 RepID=A0ABV8XMF1_9DEIO
MRPIPHEIRMLGTQVWLLARLTAPDVNQIFTACHSSLDFGPAAVEQIRAVAQARGRIALRASVAGLPPLRTGAPHDAA